MIPKLDGQNVRSGSTFYCQEDALIAKDSAMVARRAGMLSALTYVAAWRAMGQTVKTQQNLSTALRHIHHLLKNAFTIYQNKKPLLYKQEKGTIMQKLRN